MSMRGQRKKIFIVGAVLLLGACSMAEFTYSMAPRIALHYADDYLHLDNDQENRALSLFRERHALHARDELPRYHAFLLDAETRFDDGLTRADVDAIFDGTRALYNLAAERTLPAAAEILAGLDEDQLDLLEERLADAAEEDREEMAEDANEDNGGRRIGETLEDMEEWVGPLNGEQRRMLTVAMRDMRPTRSLWLAWRIDANARLLKLLRERPGTETIEKYLADRWVHRDGLPAELTSAWEENRQRYRDMIVALDAMLSAEQRGKVRERLTEYTGIVVELMPSDIRLALKQAGKGASQASQ